jgi:pyridoxine 5-phosphate synthase
VYNLRKMMTDEFPGRELNVEGFPDARFLALVRDVQADQVTLVPDTPDQSTSDHGWDFAADGEMLRGVVADLKNNGHRVALFADPDAEQMKHAAETGADRVELYTGPYGGSYHDAIEQQRELDRLAEAVTEAERQGLMVNAGHDLTVDGTARLIARIPSIAEVSIGHALFCDTLTYGMAETVRRYLVSCAAKPENS